MWLLLAYVAAVGAAVGSFLNVVIARLPAGESLVRPRSRCPACHAQIAWYDNIPLLSFCLLSARCRACKARISPRYFLVELIMAALAVAVFLRLGLSWQLLVWGPIVPAFLAIVFLDIDHYWIPDVIVLPCLLWALGGALLPGGTGLAASALGLLPALGLFLFALGFARLAGREGMGLGDIKLYAVMGALFGLLPAVILLLLASIQGSIAGLLLVATGGHKAKDPPAPLADGEEVWTPPPRAVPFGPFLILACLELLLLPHVFLEIPLSLLYLEGLWP